MLVLVGTKAQYIKTAPILRELDAQRVPYRLVYTGQHSETFDLLEAAFGTRPADDVMVPQFEAATHASFAQWTFAFWRKALARIVRGEWRGARFLIIILRIATLYSPLKLFAPASLFFGVLGVSYYAYTYATQSRFTNMSALLLSAAVIVFLIGLVSEQITALTYRRDV